MLPRVLRAALSAQSSAGCDPVLQIDLLGEQVRAPLLSDLATATGAEARLLHGGIDHVQDQPFGRLYVALCGSGEDLGDRAATFLRDRVVGVKVIGHVPRAV